MIGVGHHMETLTRQTSKNEAVLAVIDRVLNQVFGKEATILIYRFLENNYCLKHNEISDNIELFARGLEEFLRSGAQVIERKILEDVRSECRLLREFDLGNVDEEVGFVTQMKLFMHKA
jgi:hypothetical protein